MIIKFIIFLIIFTGSSTCFATDKSRIRLSIGLVSDMSIYKETDQNTLIEK